MLAQHGVNIEELETEVPATITVDEIRGILEAIPANLLVDLAFAENDAAPS